MSTPHKNYEIHQVNLFSSEFKENSYAFYAKLRKHEPVYRFIFPTGQIGWLITRYEDAQAVLKDHRFIKNPNTLLSKEQINKMFPMLERDLFIHHMLNSDPPDHTRLRSLVQKVFTPKMVENLRGRVQEIADTLLDTVQNKGEMNIIDEYAFPLPIIVISEILGIPAEGRDQFREWSNTILETSNVPEKLQQSSSTFKAFIQYLGHLIEERRKNTAEDLVSALINAETEEEKLTEKELYSIIFLIIIAGHDTTVNLISNGVLALLQHPKQLEKLKGNPELISSAVEEVLRFYGPVELATNRWASEDILLHEKLIRKGDIVVAALASANRDETQFENPDQFDITRKNNHHLAFGMGIHFCLGAPLARLEGQIALGTLLRRMPNLQLKTDVETLKWRPTYLMRGLTELPVMF
ncbi:cytochrome P450 family protein [Bacillus pseudomycoides]|uniref:Cytochrome P450 n=1 Tax=Bacillus pseudomycoides TaxID=64104 RepID=A0A2A8C0T7_9BACI|nr:cytochrome P450 [Bacillus pseudomycoides]PED69390.1 cytochrome P450 [Bacillus pseudomycoides]PEI31313.1 cytochrome P450 [Bacillus pseudomycoides]PEJ70565.1 cytochrome P450 [Bacillus pseudomycoides]PEM08334.1 cytochrome P450 [Bacillus pseudomycoides]PEM66399.1 cytochrome P450 [Bacillus pseudomycoides]